VCVRPSEHDVAIGKYFLQPSSPRECQNPAFWAIGCILVKLNRPDAALTLYQQALHVRQTQLGDHPDTAASLDLRTFLREAAVSGWSPSWV
jgi:hypothetical protein